MKLRNRLTADQLKRRIIELEDKLANHAHAERQALEALTEAEALGENVTEARAALRQVRDEAEALPAALRALRGEVFNLEAQDSLNREEIESAAVAKVKGKILDAGAKFAESCRRYMQEMQGAYASVQSAGVNVDPAASVIMYDRHGVALGNLNNVLELMQTTPGTQISNLETIVKSAGHTRARDIQTRRMSFERGWDKSKAMDPFIGGQPEGVTRTTVAVPGPDYTDAGRRDFRSVAQETRRAAGLEA